MASELPDTSKSWNSVICSCATQSFSTGYEPAADVKDEPAADVKDEPAADVKDVEPAPKRQKLDAEVNLYVAELIELRQSQSDQFPSGWLASIEYGGKTYEIDSDVLEEGFRAKDTTPKTPLEQKPGFDWNVLYQGMGEHIARTSLDYVHLYDEL